MSIEFYRKYRPSLWKHVLGQPEIVKSLRKKVEAKTVPHALLFAGASGSGKTTCAYILRNKLGCSDHDFTEINAAKSRGIDMIREVSSSMMSAPLDGPCRVYLLDEIHSLTRDGQDAALKMLEEPPDHAYFILCTTRPEKLLETIRGRCMRFSFKPLTPDLIQQLLKDVCAREKQTIADEVLERIAETVDGSARKAIMILEQVLSLDSTEEQLNAVQSAEAKEEALNLCRALTGKASWSEIQTILKRISDVNIEDANTIRLQVLGYANKIILGAPDTSQKAKRAFTVLYAFENDFYASGKFGLTRACWEVMHS